MTSNPVTVADVDFRLKLAVERRDQAAKNKQEIAVSILNTRIQDLLDERNEVDGTA